MGGVSEGGGAPLGTLPSSFAAYRCRARALAVIGGPAHAAGALDHGAAVVVASVSAAFARQLREALAGAGLDVSLSRDVTGVELAGCAKNAAAFAAAAAAAAGPNAAGAAAGRVFAEVDAIARRRGGRSETFAGLAGTGDLIATALAEGSRNRRAGELVAQGIPPQQIPPMLGHAVEAVDLVPLLALVARDERLDAPAIQSLAALLDGRLAVEGWTATVIRPAARGRARAVRAA
ncbi:MAG TPA: NAD(P)H-dependent glycerol-3-phosphate dehydrogenase [Solirubrobacteraceae bacterium]|nr:NAD(P)H-dependent glycerol-3-phosphate dehydrogenase [Solirubrobacteraceae bacterium]